MLRQSTQPTRSHVRRTDPVELTLDLDLRMENRSYSSV